MTTVEVTTAEKPSQSSVPSKSGSSGSVNIYAHRNLNFHTQEIPGGLVFCAAGVTTRVPGDVEEQNPLFQRLVDAGYITVMGGGQSGQTSKSDKGGQSEQSKDSDTPSSKGPVVTGGPPGPAGDPNHAPMDEDKNIDRKPPGEEDELGPPMSQAEFELRTPLKPVSSSSEQKGSSQNPPPNQQKSSQSQNQPQNPPAKSHEELKK